MKCPKCQTDNPSDSKFCRECATPIPASVADALPAHQKDHISFTKTLETTSDELARGTLFAGRYEIIEELGAGGMGRVYRAYDKKIEEEVALKLIRPEIAAEKRTVDRFRNEIKTARKITHKNVCRTHDLGEEGKTLFITMEYVRGEDLKSLIRRTRTLSTGTAVSIARQVGEGLGEAHSLGVVHRDLKPGNIMIDKDGNAKIMDFGIARSLAGPGTTVEGAVIGTPEYMSPEQVDGKPADQRADIYALGVILFEMVTGRPPFEGETAFSIANKHKSEPAADPRTLNPQVPEDLSRLILRCLEKEKETRYQTTGDLLADLDRVEPSLPAGERTPAGRPATKPKPATSKTITVKIIPRKLIIPAFGLIAIVAIVLGLMDFLPGGRKVSLDSIAVLPLRNLSGDPEQEYFVDSMTEALIAELAQISHLRVISRTSAMMFKEIKKPLPEIAKELNVAVLVEGSVIRSGEQVKISIQLIQANPEKHLLANHYTHAIRDILNLPEEAARSIVDEIKPKLTAEEKTSLQNASHVNPEAYELVLRGRYLLDQFTEQSLWQSIDYFKKAIEKDPAYAKAYHSLGEAYMCLVTFGLMAPLEGQPKGREYIQKATELDGTLAEPHVGLAWDKMFYTRDWEGAEREFKKALELNPNSRDAHEFYGMFLATVRGDWEKALFHLNRALEIDPLNLMLRTNLAGIIWNAGQKDRAFAEIQGVLNLAPNFATAYYSQGLFYIEEKMCEKAIAELEKALSLMGESPMLKGPLGFALAMAGRKEEARRILEELKELSKTKYVSSFYIALIHAGLEENDQVFEYLEKAYEENARELIMIKKEPGLAPVRSDPRFADLLNKIGLRQNDMP